MQFEVEKHSSLGGLAGLLFVLSLVTGCGQQGAELATVSGTVRMDGQPLPNVLVEFQPEEGSPSYGTTNAEGYYFLKYSRSRDGARPGRHTVRIKATEVVNDDGEVVQSEVKVPARYYRKSELTAVVESGSNTLDFDLTSNPK
jgi:hypothetical protein